jgi:hypothetical protein
LYAAALATEPGILLTTNRLGAEKTETSSRVQQSEVEGEHLDFDGFI